MTSRSTLAAALVIAGVWATQFAWIAPTNFSGTDEWLYLSLTSRGIVDFPHTQRPLTLLWTLPGALARHRFVGFHVVDGAYLLLTGWLVYALVRRMAPGSGPTALLAGVFALAWAPRDMARLLTVQTTVNTGVTAAALLALALCVESWLRHRPLLLAMGCVVAFVAMRSYEAVGPLLLVGSALVPWVAGWTRPAWRWSVAFALSVGAAAALAAVSLHRPEATYQHSLGLSLQPAAVGARLIEQFGYHLVPLLHVRAAATGGIAVAIAVGAFLLGLGLVAAVDREPAAIGRRRLAALAAWGALLSAAGYAPFVVLSSTGSATRTQFLSSFGMAVLLAAGATLAASILPERWRRAALAAMGAWVVALATGNTIAMQSLWTGLSAYPAQTSTLRQLTAHAPDVRPHTLLVLLDEGGAFPAVFTFHHAVGYLYDRRAAGVVWGASDYLYSFAFDPEGVRLEPWPAIRKAWRDEPTRYGYDEVIVARRGADGRLALLRDWSPALPPLPASARYDPEARIVRGGAPVPAQGILYRP